MGSFPPTVAAGQNVADDDRAAAQGMGMQRRPTRRTSRKGCSTQLLHISKVPKWVRSHVRDTPGIAARRE
jgi:hypothetical protein